MVSIAEQLQCARRELEMRRRIYPSWVQRGKMKQDKADHEMQAMQAIVDSLEYFRMVVEKEEYVIPEVRA